MMTREAIEPPMPMFIDDAHSLHAKSTQHGQSPNGRRVNEVEVCGLVTGIDERTVRSERFGNAEQAVHTSSRSIDVQDGTGVLRLREWAPTGTTFESHAWQPPLSMGSVIIALGPLSRGVDGVLFMKPQTIIVVESVLREVYWISRTMHLHKHMFPAMKKNAEAASSAHSPSILHDGSKPCRQWLELGHMLGDSFDINDLRVALRKCGMADSEKDAMLLSDGWVSRGIVYANSVNVFFKVTKDGNASDWTELHDYVYAVVRDLKEPAEFRYVCRRVTELHQFRVSSRLVQSILLHICSVHRGRMRYSPDQRFFLYLQ